MNKFASGLIVTQNFLPDGLLDTSIPATIVLDASAGADTKAAFDAWVAAGNDPANIPADRIFLDDGSGTAIDARAFLTTLQNGTPNTTEVSSNDILIGNSVAGGGDMLIGGMGDDLLIGGSGDDVLWAGQGNDIMAGGAGDDIYMIDGGGHDIIEDKQGNNRVFLNGKVLFEFTTSDGINYLSRDGAFSGIMSNGDFIVTDNATGDQVTLNQNFQSGDFGIILSDASQPPTQTTTILGDIIPDDTDLTKAGIQAADDAHGNPIGQGGAYADILGGTAGNDHILSGELNDDVGGGAGDDWIEGGVGSDYLHGGIGNDVVEGGEGSDIVAGEAGDDRLYGNAQIDTATAIANGNTNSATGAKGDWLAGGTGDDTLVAGADNDVLSGGEGNDLLIAGAGDDYILGDADYLPQYIWSADSSYQIGSTNWYHSAPSTFDWSVTPQADGSALFQTIIEYAPGNSPAAGNDIIYAGDGNDHVWAGSGSDIVYGEGGADTLNGEGGNDVIFGGTGDDTLWGAEDNDYLDGGDGDDTLWGGNGDDVLTGGIGADKLYGEAGANYLEGGEGDDTLNSGGPGSVLMGGAGNDDISAAGGGNTLDGGAGDDILAADGDDNYLDGGEGANSLQSVGNNNALFAGAGNDDLAAWGDGNYLDAGDGANTLYVQGVNNELYAGSGDDILQAAGGNNYLDGGDGNNSLIAEGGNTTLFAGSGDDLLSSAGGGNYFDAGDGNNTLIATGGGNILYAGSGNDSLSAGGGNSYLDGGDGNDTLIADGGGNILMAGAGNDTLIAGGGNNTLYGGGGDDTLIAHGGGNTLDGGEGRDLYVFDTGFGVNHISDSGTGGNTLRFNFAFVGSGIVVGLGSLKLSFANGDELHIDNFDPENPASTCSIDTFVFDDQTLSLQDILIIGGPAVQPAAGPDITGTAGADMLIGTDRAETIRGLAGHDTINGGAGNDTIEGGGGDDTIDGGSGADVMKGGAGDDTYVVDNTADTVSEQVNEGWDLVKSSVSYTLGSHVEDLFLTGADDIDGIGNALGNYISGNGGDNILLGHAGDDWLLGGAGDDTLSGGAGDDWLDGEAGADSMAGGAGDDAYMVDDSGDTVSENLNEGIDSVRSTVTYTLGANLENLSLTGTDNIDGVGNALDNRIGGNSGNNILRGEAGDDTLTGGAGADTMIGGAGNDTYSVDEAGDVVVENANGGVDLVHSSINYVLGDNVENLSLYQGAYIGTGNALNNIIAGNNSSNNDRINYVLSGGAGNDTLTGNNFNDTLNGGSGADVMTGGMGNDTYLVDNSGDQVFENVNGGLDTVQSSISFTLGYQVENLILTGTANINGTGNELNNVIIGNSGDNILTDPSFGDDILDGGAGADIMSGGYYNDTYYVDNVGDQVVEIYAGFFGGNDIVYSSVTFTLGANVEDLTLTGAENINGMGNELANVITGNDGVNVLAGGAGDDTYYVQTTGDTVIEGADNGYDRVYTKVDLTLGGNVEFLALMDGAIVGIGDDSNNDIEGNHANNVLDGRAGDDHLDGFSGNDVIFGGAGDDTIYGGYDAYYQDDNGWRLIDNSDVLDGGAGDDRLDGGSGDDTIMGGIGNDTLFGGEDDGGEGADTLSNNDVIDGGDGDDSIDGGSGADRLYGGSGDDVIYGGGDSRYGYFFDYATRRYILASSDDLLDGGDGDDILDGGSGADRLFGGAGDDTIYGGDNGWYSYTYDPVADVYIAMLNDDYLDGGAGIDVLIGGQGDDVYVVDGSYARLADVPVVNDCGNPALAEQLVWTADTVIEYADEGYDIVMSSASYVLADNVEELRLTFDPLMAADDPQRYADLLVFGQDGAGNALDNVIVGNELNNRLDGGLGDDTLEGAAGDDTLIGGRGNDILSGGAGNDRYVFRRGDGADVIDDSQGIDTLYIGNGLTVANIRTIRVGDGLVLNINNSNDSITLSNWFVQDEGVKRLEFCDGSVLDSLWNDSLNVASIADQLASEDEPFSWTVPEDVFVDAGGGSLSYSAMMSDGSALPGWLSFDSVTQTFSGTPTNWDVGMLDVTVTASNSSGLGSSSFVLTVLNTNDAPEVIASLQDQSIAVEQVFRYSLPAGIIANSFLNDAEDTGTPDQVWLTYDKSLYGSGGDDTYTFMRGDGTVCISEWDNTPMDTVRFGPGISSADVSISQNKWGDVVLSLNGSSDKLILSYWIGYEDARIEQVTFADGMVWGLSDLMSMISTAPSAASDWIIGTGENDAIYALGGDDGVRAGAGDDTVFGGSGHDDLEGGGGSDLLIGGSGADVLWADENYGDGANDLLAGGMGDDSLNAAVSNDLLIGGRGNDSISGYDGNNVILFNRGDGNDKIDPSFSGMTVPSETLSLGGGINYADLSFRRSGSFELILDVGNGESVSFPFWYASWEDLKFTKRLQIVTEAMAGYAPDSADPLLDKRIQQFDFIALVNQFEADRAADPTITTWQLGPYLADFSLGGSDTAAIGGDMAYLYGKNGNLDGLSEVELRAQLNDIAFGSDSQTLTKTSPVAGTGVFNDVDFIHGDRITCSATLADGSALPAWLTFDAVTGVFSGIPESSDAGILIVAVTATDAGGLSATTNFVLTVTGNGPINAVPLASADTVSASEDTAQITMAIADLLANDTDPDTGDTLALSGFDATTALGNTVGQDANGNLVLDIGNNYQSLGAGQTVTDSFNYTISDTAGATSSATVAIAIAGANDAPVVAIFIAGQQINEDATLSFSVPTNTFTDIDNGDTLAYSAKLADDSELPGWLSFDAVTRTFSGTPLNGDVGSLNVVVRATDTGGLSASSMFSFNIVNVNDMPTAHADSGTATEDGGAALLDIAGLLANDTDPDFIHGDVLDIVGVSQSDSGAAVSLVDGAVRYDAGALFQSLGQGQTATDTFNYTVIDTAGATSSATVTMMIAGVNDGPVAVADAAFVREDTVPIASGNVLANDSDVDQGSVLGVADAGNRTGHYGRLVLATDGSYIYRTDNSAMAVQSLGRDARVAEHFGYTVTDGIAGVLSGLDVFLNGTNDAPVLVAPLADQHLTFHKNFSWQMPAGSFIDIDQGDTLAYSVTQADGSALPEWLNFNVVTRTFSGKTPKQTGFVDVRVTATDSVAATGNTAGSLSASDVFRITVSHGNEGVGNGSDAPPAGHGCDFNDGPGTSPGHSGNKKQGSDSHSHGEESGGRFSDKKSDTRDAHAKDHEKDDRCHTDDLVRSWFDKESASEQFLDCKDGRGSQTEKQVNQNVARGVSGDVAPEWERMNVQLKAHLERSGGDEGISAGLGVGGGSLGLYGLHGQQNVAPSSMGNSQQMKGFAGLREGLERLVA